MRPSKASTASCARTITSAYNKGGASSPGLIGKRVTKRGSRHSQTVSHRCSLRYRKYKQTCISSPNYPTMPSSWLDTSRESGWENEAAAACNDTGGLARLLSCTYEKAKENMKSVFFKRMGDPLRAHLCLKRPTPLARVYV